MSTHPTATLLECNYLLLSNATMAKMITVHMHLFVFASKVLESKLVEQRCRKAPLETETLKNENLFHGDQDLILQQMNKVSFEFAMMINPKLSHSSGVNTLAAQRGGRKGQGKRKRRGNYYICRIVAFGYTQTFTPPCISKAIESGINPLAEHVYYKDSEDSYAVPGVPSPPEATSQGILCEMKKGGNEEV